LSVLSNVVNAGDLATVTLGNLLCKYADDIYIIVPAANIQTRTAEIAGIEQWAIANNLKLNRTKSVEIIVFCAKRSSRVSLPHALSDIRRVTSLKMLGITMTIRCQPVSMSMTLYADVLNQSMLLEHYEAMA